MNSKLHWNDLQLVLSVADTGTLIGAAEHLEVSHATVSRRLSAIENRLKVKLFNRGRSGCVPTLAGEELTATAQHLKSHVAEVERRIIGRDLDLSGVIRITTLDSLLVGLLNPLFFNFQAEHPKINLEVSLSNQLFSLSKHEADIAIRPTLNPDETLYGRKVGTLTYAVYGQDQLISQSTEPINISDMNWLGPDKAMIYPALEKWMDERNLDRCCRFRTNSVLGLYSAARERLGLAVLPCYLGEPDTKLTRIGGVIPEMTIDLWVLTHRDMKKSARIKTLIKFLSENVDKQINRFSLQ